MRTPAELMATCEDLRARAAGGERLPSVEVAAVLEDISVLVAVLVENMAGATDTPPLAEQVRASQVRSRARREGGRA